MVSTAWRFSPQRTSPATVCRVLNRKWGRSCSSRAWSFASASCTSSRPPPGRGGADGAGPRRHTDRDERDVDHQFELDAQPESSWRLSKKLFGLRTSKGRIQAQRGPGEQVEDAHDQRRDDVEQRRRAQRQQGPSHRQREHRRRQQGPGPPHRDVVSHQARQRVVVVEHRHVHLRRVDHREQQPASRRHAEDPAEPEAFRAAFRARFHVVLQYFAFRPHPELQCSESAIGAANGGLIGVDIASARRRRISGSPRVPAGTRG